MPITNPDVAQRSSNENLYQTPIGIPAFLEGPLVVRKPDGTTYSISSGAAVGALITLLGQMGLIEVTA
ncbi:MAG: hypothetical protein ACRCYS_01860 [Beijerinckiaceae bacterium]